MNEVVGNLRAFYEQEAADGRRDPPSGPRVEERTPFIDRMVAEGRSRLLEVGCGPGLEARAFADAGLQWIGLDLAVENAKLGRRNGATVVPGLLFALPFPAASFDSCWSMSTFMHVPMAEFDRALAETVQVLTPGSPLAIGMWGSSDGSDREIVTDFAGRGTRRLFSLRTAATNRQTMVEHLAIERFEVWDLGPDDWEYHFIEARTPT